MTLLRYLFFAIWFATVAIRVLLAWKMFRLQLAKSYPWFTAFLMVSTVETCARMYAGFSGGGRAYNEAWARWQWITLLMLAGLAVECFILHAKHFRRFLVAGSVTAVALTVIAVALWMPTAGIETLPRPDAPSLTRITRDLCTIAFILVSLTSIAFGFFGKAWIRPNVRMHAAVLQWLFFLQACAYFVRGGVLQGQWFGVVAAFLTTGGALYCYIRWFVSFSREGEHWQQPAAVNHEELEALEERRRFIAKIGR